MYLLESFKSALQNVKSNKMRSFLTMLGIIIGISSVITIVSLGQGGQAYITGQFASIGTNIINVSVSSTQTNIRDSDYFSLEDVKAIKDKIAKVETVVPFSGNNPFGSSGTLKTESKSKQVQVTSTTADSIKVQSMEILYGRFLRERDIEAGSNVVVIDDTAAEKLFRTTDAVGQKVTLSLSGNNANVTVIGVIKNPAGNLASSFRENMPGSVVIPITLNKKLLPNSKIGRLSIVLTDMDNSSEVSSKIVRLLEMRHNTVDRYTAEEGFKQLDTINNVLNMLTLVIGAIASISLIVGGIGVMNIMLVSVTERTREIGIRKALGATMRDIRMQFLTESLILCLIGGSIGMLLGITLGNLAGSIINVSAVVSTSIVLLAFLFSSAVGIFFGLYPANKAAKLDPIEALRYE